MTQIIQKGGRIGEHGKVVAEFENHEEAKQERFKKLRCPFCRLSMEVLVYETLQNSRGSYEYGSMNCGCQTFVVGTKDNVYKRASELVKGMKKRRLTRLSLQ